MEAQAAAGGKEFDGNFRGAIFAEDSFACQFEVTRIEAKFESGIFPAVIRQKQSDQKFTGSIDAKGKFFGWGRLEVQGGYGRFFDTVRLKGVISDPG